MSIDVDEFLEHHGVKGMKWGLRKGRLSVGPRTRATIIERNKRLVKVHENIRDRTGSKTARALSLPDKLLLGEEKFKQFHNKKIADLNKQSVKLKSGSIKVKDIIKGA